MQITCENVNCMLKPLALVFGLAVVGILLFKGGDTKPLGMIIAFITVAIGGSSE